MTCAGRSSLVVLMLLAVGHDAVAGTGWKWPGQSCASPPGAPCDGPACAKPPIAVKVILKTPPAKPHHHCWWCCLPPPRGPVLDTVAIERVQAPFVRSEMVVQREQLRVVPVVAEERVRQPALERVPAAERKDCSIPEQKRESTACAGDPALEDRLLRMEKSIEAMRQLMVEQKQREIDALER